MKAALANIFTGFMLCLSLVLFVAASQNGSVHVANVGPTNIHGPLSVDGDVTVTGSVFATRSISGDSVAATAILKAFQCLLSYDKMAAQDSSRLGKFGFTAGGERVSRIRAGSFTLDVTSISASSSLDMTVTINGLDVATNWVVDVRPLSADLPAGISIGTTRVTADNTVKVRFNNATTSPVDPASQTYSWIAFRQ